MIHLEIIKLNFCKLNEFTKRNIELRGSDDSLFLGRDSTTGTNSIEFETGYIIDNIGNYNVLTEMREQEGEEDINYK